MNLSYCYQVLWDMLLVRTVDQIIITDKNSDTLNGKDLTETSVHTLD